MTEDAKPKPASSPAVKKEDVKNESPAKDQAGKELPEKDLENVSGGLLRKR